MLTNLRISEAAILALHSAVFMAANTDRLVSTKEIASALDVSEAHLSKVLQRLVKVGLVKSVRGPGGGFSLYKDASEISLLEVYESIDGPIVASNCLLSSPVCNRGSCILGDLLKNINDEIKIRLRGTTLDKLSDVFKNVGHKKGR